MAKIYNDTEESKEFSSEYEDISIVPIPERHSCFLNNMMIKEKKCKRIKVPDGLIETLGDFYASKFLQRKSQNK